MTKPSTSAPDPEELAKFDRPDLDWWDPEGPMRALHVINPVRAQYVREHCVLQDRAVADIGCGGGLLAEALARAGARVTAIDPSASAITTAQAHARAHQLDIAYQCQELDELVARQEQSYDVVTCMELLEHVSDPYALLAGCVRLLRPGGALFVSTLNRTPGAFLLAIVGAEHVLRLLPVGTHRYDRFIKPSELARGMRDLGIAVTNIQGLEYHPLRHTARLTRHPRINYLMHGHLH